MKVDIKRSRREAAGFEIKAISDQLPDDYNDMPKTAAIMLSEGMDVFEEAIIGLTKDFDVSLWSTGAEQKLGYSRAEMLGKSIKRLVPPDKYKEYETKIVLIREGQMIDKLKTKRLHKNGHTVDVAISLAPVFDDQEKFNGAIGVYKDITEKLELTKRLKEQEERWRLALQGGCFCVWDYTLGNKIMNNYGGWRKLLGYSEEEASNHIDDLLLLVHPEDRIRVFQMLHHNNHQDYLVEFRIRCKNNEYKWVRTKGRVFDRDEFGRPLRIVGVHEEITGRKIIEEKLKDKCIQLEYLKQEADNANKMKSLFLANMSHEIRTPINGIIGTVQLLQLTELSKEQEIITRRLKNATDLLLITFNDILEISKIESNNLMLKHEPFDLKETIHKVYDTLLTQGKAKRLEVALNIDPTISYGLIGDEHRLMQILNNLISNSIKFTDKGGISFRVVKSGMRNNREKIEFIVQDTGIGIEDSFKDRIFQSFSQGDLSTEKKHMGSGLGLAIANRIALLMGGDIRFTSRVGEGSEFIFTGEFERSDCPEKAKQKEGLKQKEMLYEEQEKVIMIVDDNMINQEIVQNLIRRKRYHFIAAYNGREALNILSSQKVDLILMDIQMPELNGIETTKIIRKKLTGQKHIPIIALTAYAMSEDEQKCREAGMDGYISKPFELSELYHMIELYLN